MRDPGHPAGGLAHDAAVLRSPTPRFRRPIHASGPCLTPARCGSAWSAPTPWSRPAGCRTTSSAWPSTCASGATSHRCWPRASCRTGWPPGWTQDRFTSAGAAVPLRYNGSVARVELRPAHGRPGRGAGCVAGAFDLVHVHEPITPSIALLALWAAEVPVVGHVPHGHAAVAVDAAGRRGAAAGGGEARRPDRRVSESARLVVVQHLGRDAVVIPNGFRFADFAPMPGLSRPSRPPAPAALPRPHRRAAQGPGRAAGRPARRSAGPCRTWRWWSPGRGTGRCRPAAPASAWSTSAQRRPAGVGRRLRRPAPGPGELRHRGPGGHGQWRPGGRLRPAAVRRPARPSRTRPGRARACCSRREIRRRWPERWSTCSAGPTRPADRAGPVAGPPVRLVGVGRAVESVYRATLDAAYGEVSAETG